MKKKIYLAGIALSLCFTSCIQDEALNVEAAIDGCKGANIQLVSLNNEKKEIDVYVSAGCDISKQELIFDIPNGALLSANEKEPQDNPPLYDFGTNQSRLFTVISEDKSNTAQYTINITKMELPHTFSFENMQQEDPYNILYLSDTSKKLVWASGNPGFKLTGMANSSKDYPTIQVPGGKKGYCIKLETKDTGSFGLTAKMPIASGNLFIGSFDTSNALSKPLEATQFGYPFTEVPLMLTGYFKFKAGEQMIKMSDKGVEKIPGKDRFDIYAVMYEASEDNFFLNGGNSLNHKNIVKLARIEESKAIETNEWIRFDLPFNNKNGKTIDKEKLQKGKYKLAIVLSSSVDGAYFKGAIGSTLYVDELNVICEKIN